MFAEKGFQHLAESVRRVAAPIVRAFELELVDVEWVGQGPRSVVRVFIDKPGGVNLDDCEHVHVSLGHALDVADPIPHAYRLEVSSPGLDRPLKHTDDYRRSIGKLVVLKLRQPFEGQWRVIGRLVELSDDGVDLAVIGSDQSRIVHFEWGSIVEGRLEVEF
jgi:ribosome maturation factor RimP